MEENQKKQQNEQGMMVVEAVLSFTVFIMVVAFIVYLITIFSVHNKIQFAINSTAKELSSYTYLYEAFGLRAAEQSVEETFDPYAENINNTVTQVSDSLNKIQSLTSSGKEVVGDVTSIQTPQDIMDSWEKIGDLTDEAGETADSIKASAGAIKEAFSDPKSLLIGMAYLGVSAMNYEIKCACAEAVAEGMTKNYLQQDGMSADEYLKKVGVKDGYAGLDFSGSSMFCDEDERLIDIIVQYDLDLGLLQFIMPKDTIHVVQRVTVPAWLDGDGKTVEFETGE